MMKMLIRELAARNRDINDLTKLGESRAVADTIIQLSFWLSLVLSEYDKVSCICLNGQKIN